MCPGSHTIFYSCQEKKNKIKNRQDRVPLCHLCLITNISNFWIQRWTTANFSVVNVAVKSHELQWFLVSFFFMLKYLVISFVTSSLKYWIFDKTFLISTELWITKFTSVFVLFHVVTKQKLYYINNLQLIENQRFLTLKSMKNFKKNFKQIIFSIKLKAEEDKEI